MSKLTKTWPRICENPANLGAGRAGAAGCAAIGGLARNVADVTVTSVRSEFTFVPASIQDAGMHRLAMPLTPHFRRILQQPPKNPAEADPDSGILPQLFNNRSSIRFLNVSNSFNHLLAQAALRFFKILQNSSRFFKIVEDI